MSLDGVERVALVISVDASRREPLRQACEAAELHVVESVSVREAVARLDELDVSLCCLACEASLENEALSARELRESLPEHTPILLLSSRTEADEHEFLFDHGASEIFHPAHLDRLTRYLREREAARTDLRGQHIFGKRVLLVDGSRAAAHAVRRQLMAIGLWVDWFHCAEDALEQLRQRRYDLLITDLALDGPMSGAAMVRQVRQDGYTDATLPILLMVDVDEPAKRREWFALGASDHVIKPVIEEELRIRAGNLIIAYQLAVQTEAQRARLHLLEVTDVLTGLYNRRMLFAMGAKYVALARRSGNPFSLVLLGVGRLGDITDKFGLDAGDEVLRLVGTSILDGARESDMVARIGDAHFAVALPQCALDDAHRVGERQRQAIADMFPFGMELAASLGVVSFDAERDGRFDVLVARAGRAIDSARPLTS